MIGSMVQGWGFTSTNVQPVLGDRLTNCPGENARFFGRVHFGHEGQRPGEKAADVVLIDRLEGGNGNQISEPLQPRFRLADDTK